MSFRSPSIVGWGAFLAALALTGCGSQATTTAPAVLAPAAGEARADAAASRASLGLPAFDPGDFVPGVNHPFLPLVPGTVHTYRGESDKGTEIIRVEVLHATRNILGVAATIVRDRVFLNGELVEDTFDWFAQDRAGNVWYLGEDVKNYEDGKLVDTAGSWEAGVNGATAGFVMLAAPRIGASYPQEHAAGVAEDQARVLSLRETVTVPYGTFTGCVKTQEWTPLEPGARDFKFYARGVGLVLEVAPRGGQRRNELISVTHP